MVVGTVTLGVSLAVPEPYGSLLQGCRLGFGDAAATGIPTHVTLLPPTEVDAADRPLIEDHLAAIAAAGRPFPMRLYGTGTFRPLSPVVFIQVVEGGSACGWLQERVREASGPLARELQFPYHPHVTVAHGIDEAAMDVAEKELADYQAAWIAEGFALYEQGADRVWRLVRQFRFADGLTNPATGAGRPDTVDPGTLRTGPGRQRTGDLRAADRHLGDQHRDSHPLGVPGLREPGSEETVLTESALGGAVLGKPVLGETAISEPGLGEAVLHERGRYQRDPAEDPAYRGLPQQQSALGPQPV